MWISFRTKAFSRGEGFRIIKRFLHCKPFLSDHTRQPLQPDRGKPCHYKQSMTFSRSLNNRSVSDPSFQIPNFKLQIDKKGRARQTARPFSIHSNHALCITN